MSHIFIAYSREDTAFAQELSRYLLNAGFDVWMDRHIAAGTQWWRSIEENIERASALIVIMSPAGHKSRWVERELQAADHFQKPIFPILYQGGIWPRLEHIQALDAHRGLTPDLIRQMERTLRAFADKKPVAPSAPIPFDEPAAYPQRSLSAVRIVVLITLFLISAIGFLVLFTLYGNDREPDRTFSVVDLTSTHAALMLAQTAEHWTNTPTREPTVTVTPQPTRSPQSTQVNSTPASTPQTPPTQTSTSTTTPTPTLSVDERVSATVAALRLTEESHLSPAEAAQLAWMLKRDADDRSTAQTLLIMLNILITILAAAGLLIALLLSRGLMAVRPRRAHPAHAVQQQAVPNPLSNNPQIFISSSDQDRIWVEMLVNRLDQELGYIVWWYAKDAPGKQFGDEIVRAIFTTKVFIVIISPDSMDSKHVEEEIRIADRYDKPIINVLYRQTDKRLYGLAKGSEIDFTDNLEEGMTYDEKYLQAITFLTEAIDPHLGLQAAPNPDENAETAT